MDISSLTVGILRSRCIVSLVTHQVASIKDLGVFDWNRWESLCWNYSLFPIVGSLRFKQVLIWLYIALFYSARLSWSVRQWASRIFLVLIPVVRIYLRCAVSMSFFFPESCPDIWLYLCLELEHYLWSPVDRIVFAAWKLYDWKFNYKIKFYVIGIMIFSWGQRLI